MFVTKINIDLIKSPRYNAGMVKRLWKLVTMSMEQQRTVEYLWLSNGICTCGQPIDRNDDKLCLAQVNSSWASLDAAKNTLAIGLYCKWCADKINVLLKSLRALPEPDKLKKQRFTGS